MHRIGNIRRWTGAIVAVVVLALLAAMPAAAASGCGQKIVDDWFEDGRVDKVYAIKCYRAALKLLPEDAQNYSSAPDEINRALQDAIRQKQEKEAAKAAEAEQQAAEAAADPPTPPPSEPAEPELPNETSAEPTEAETPAAEAQAEEASAAGGIESDVDPPPPPPETTEQATSGVAGTTADEATAAEAPEDTNGVVGQAIGKLGSGSADSVPVPLIIIGGLALALLAAGGAALIARRLKARDQ